MAIPKPSQSRDNDEDARTPALTLITIEDGREQIITEENDARNDETARKALGVFGAWSDLDWEEVADALDRIRHESAPTPPVHE